LRESENFGRFSASFHPISPARMQPFIKYLRIENYKSIDKLELHDVPPFAVFAGANGSGKSNFFDALEFVSEISRFNLQTAMREGYERIHSFLRDGDVATIFAFEMIMEHPTNVFKSVPVSKYVDADNYHGGYDRFEMEIRDWNTEPFLVEKYWVNDKKPVHERYGIDIVLHDGRLPIKDKEPPEKLQGSLLQMLRSDLAQTINRARIFHIDPIGLPVLAVTSNNAGELDKRGYNIASVLERLEQDDEIREIILDMLSLCVPSIENISVKRNRLNMSSELYFKQEGIDQEFPIGMVSDGTIALLCILVVVLDTKKRAGLTMIEEPERGLHPEAISQIVAFMRERATPQNPIWLTTHSEAVVRATQEGDLFFVEKEDGRTVIKPALPYTNGSFSRDRAWLSNALGGGLPW
jgi:predicted ATP-dependent endonuclease of OLD family